MKKSWMQFRRLLRYATPYFPTYLLILVGILVLTGARLLEPKLIQMLIDEHLTPLGTMEMSQAIRSAHISDALRMSLFYLLCVVLSVLGIYSSYFLTQKVGALIVTDMRKDLYEHVLRLPMRYFDRHSIGGIVTRVTNDTESVLELYTFVFTNLFMNLFNLIGILVVMVSLNVELAFFMLLLTPVIILISVVFQKQIRRVYDIQRAIRSTINTKLAENISGMSVIQTFYKEKAIYREFDETNRSYYQASRREVFDYAIYRPSVELLQALGLAALFWFGGLRQMEGVLTFGVLYAFINYLQRFFRPILQMAEIFNVMQSAFSSSERVLKLLDEEEENAEGRPVPSEGFIGKIEFDHVWFRYNQPEENVEAEKDNPEEEQWILKDVSFTIEPGMFVAFVGATGAGKSTILSLIARFYEVERGEIRIDGVDVRAYDPVALRRALGIVQQDVFLFRGDIMSNIRIGRPRVDRQAVVDAARLVNADHFISRLPKGYDEPVMERGATLSAGQQQLLSFARTIAGDPSILILDEATANIDTETEQLIQDAIQNMSRNRTMLAVAHRISTIAGADQIIVMHHGEIAEQGTQEELIQKDGLFRVLYELQYGKEV